MSFQEFNDDCPGCRPVILDPVTMKPLPEDSPSMKAVRRVWAETTLDERRLFHEFTCLNSRKPETMRAMLELSKRVERAMDQ